MINCCIFRKKKSVCGVVVGIYGNVTQNFKLKIVKF